MISTSSVKDFFKSYIRFIKPSMVPKKIPKHIRNQRIDSTYDYRINNLFLEGKYF